MKPVPANRQVRKPRVSKQPFLPDLCTETITHGFTVQNLVFVSVIVYLLVLFFFKLQLLGRSCSSN